MAPCRVVQICSALLIRTDLHPGLSVRQMIHRPGQGGGEKFLHGSVAAVPRAQPDHLRWWALYIHQADDVVNRHPTRAPSHQNGMVNLPRCLGQGGLQVLRFQIREIGQDLLAALPSGKELKDVPHTEPQLASSTSGSSSRRAMRRSRRASRTSDPGCCARRAASLLEWSTRSTQRSGWATAPQRSASRAKRSRLTCLAAGPGAVAEGFSAGIQANRSRRDQLADGGRHAAQALLDRC